MAEPNAVDVFGSKVREIRKARGWSVERLAREADVTQSYLSQLEAGQRPKPGINIILKIATALRVSLDELLGFDPEALPAKPQEPAGAEERLDRIERVLERVLEMGIASREAAADQAEAREADSSKPAPQRATGSPQKPEKKKR